MTAEQRIDAQSAHRRCYERIAALEAALRAVVDARGQWIATIGQAPAVGYGHEDRAWGAYLAALDQAAKVLNG